MTNTFHRNDATFSPIAGSDLSGTIGSSNLPAAIAFSAHKNGSDQTGIADSTFTKLTWSTEVYDSGNFFASDAWTPPAGKVSLTSAGLLSGTWSAGAQMAISIFKNGSTFKQANWYAPAANVGAVFIATEDVAGGSDVYDVRIFMDVSGGTGTVSGTANNTFFVGHWIGP
jgi:hypothetical protein